MFLWTMAREKLLYSLLLIVASSLRTVSSGDDFFDDEFNNEFEKMDKNDQFHNQLEDGFKNWEERCLANGGKKVLEDYLAEQEQLVYCIMEQFDMDELQQEIEEKKKVGDLDEVFKKYCGNHVGAARACLQSFLSVSQQCLKEEDRPGLNVTLQMVDRAIEFTCHNAGDRIALFMSEDGVECVTAHKEEILACINNSVPEVFNTYNNLNNYKMHFYVFQQDNCRKGDAIMQCVESSLMKCDDPTPSNLVHGLLNAMKDGTPCARAAQGWHSGFSESQTRTQLLLAVIAMASVNLSL
eukprot:GFUD01008779.1.p1 GENE.GFUD01008779.1~~GFUD01008779.1.p1  ORF type:complete len:296 (-),score=89.30 GFUD01008779.1:1195-2082(-)